MYIEYYDKSKSESESGQHRLDQEGLQVEWHKSVFKVLRSTQSTQRYHTVLPIRSRTTINNQHDKKSKFLQSNPHSLWFIIRSSNKWRTPPSSRWRIPNKEGIAWHKCQHCQHHSSSNNPTSKACGRKHHGPHPIRRMAL
jgi:hypothetical protein